MWNRPRSGLLPTPGENHHHVPSPKPHRALLPHPVHRTEHKQIPRNRPPLLKTPFKPNRAPLLGTPVVKRVSEHINTWEKPNPQRQPANTGMYESVSLHRKSFVKPTNFIRGPAVRGYESKKNDQLLKKQVYNQRKEKKHQPTAATALLNSELVTKVANRVQSDNNMSDESEDLTFLARYLLRMKSSSNPEDKQTEDKPETLKLSKTEADKPDSVNHSLSIDDIISVSDSAVVIESPKEKEVKKPLDDNDEKVATVKMPLDNNDENVATVKMPLDDNDEKVATVMPIDTDETLSAPKNKKQKIQLSQYASVCEHTIINDSSQKNTSVQHSVSAVKTSQNHGDSTQILHRNDFENSKLSTTPAASLVHPDDKPIEINKKESDDSHFDNTMHSGTASNSPMELSDDKEATPQDKDSSHIEHAEDKTIDSLPFIFPVSGYFCDVCCDFFFDEESTFQHCRSSQHRSKVEIAAQKVDNDKEAKNPVKRLLKEEASGDERKKQRLLSEKETPLQNVPTPPSKVSALKTNPIKRGLLGDGWQHQKRPGSANKWRQNSAQSFEGSTIKSTFNHKTQHHYDEDRNRKNPGKMVGKWNNFVIPKRK